ncbi:MAG: hypothetical protein ACRDUA_06810 [Micromonosporaceae bacterium]
MLTILSEATPGEVACVLGSTARTDVPRAGLLADPAVAERVAAFVTLHDTSRV